MALLRSAARAIRFVGPDIRKNSWFPQQMERHFDRVMGTNTASFVLKDSLDIDPARREQAKRYIPTSAPQFRSVISSLDIPISEFTFIDF